VARPVTLERKLAVLCCLHRSEEAASAAHTASRVIDRIYAKSTSLRIPRSWLSIAEDLFPGTSTPTTTCTISKDSVSANVGVKSWLV
jgi:hypothetical protein